MHTFLSFDLASGRERRVVCFNEAPERVIAVEEKEEDTTITPLEEGISELINLINENNEMVGDFIGDITERVDDVAKECIKQCDQTSTFLNDRLLIEVRVNGQMFQYCGEEMIKNYIEGEEINAELNDPQLSYGDFRSKLLEAYGNLGKKQANREGQRKYFDLFINQYDLLNDIIEIQEDKLENPDEFQPSGEMMKGVDSLNKSITNKPGGKENPNTLKILQDSYENLPEAQRQQALDWINTQLQKGNTSTRVMDRNGILEVQK